MKQNRGRIKIVRWLIVTALICFYAERTSSQCPTPTFNPVSPQQFGSFGDGFNHLIVAQDITDHGPGGSKTLWMGKIVRTVTDGVTISGNKIVTSATANFTSADVGQRISGVGLPPES